MIIYVLYWPWVLGTSVQAFRSARFFGQYGPKKVGHELNPDARRLLEKDNYNRRNILIVYNTYAN